MKALNRLGMVLLLGAVPTAADAATMAAPPSVDDPAFQKQMLDTQNAARRALGVPDLVWSKALASEASRWVKTLAASDRIAHDGQTAHGENIYMSRAGRLTPPAMVQGWIVEKRFYKPGKAQPDVSTTGNWADVGHYTAVVWSTTTAVGCAMARNPNHDFLVCRYDPPGNLPGSPAYDVKIAQRVQKTYQATNAKTAAPAKPK